jgi:anti-sigma regulatory factor (Ser/Thr protein kinase)
MEPVMSARREFQARATEVRAARAFAVGASEHWGLNSTVVEMVVGELAANAYVHARSPFTVSLTSLNGRVSIEVSDASSEVPVLLTDDPESAHGRGLLIVNALVRAWGSRPTDRGKIVWAELGPAPSI